MAGEAKANDLICAIGSKNFRRRRRDGRWRTLRRICADPPFSELISRQFPLTRDPRCGDHPAIAGKEMRPMPNRVWILSARNAKAAGSAVLPANSSMTAGRPRHCAAGRKRSAFSLLAVTALPEGGQSAPGYTLQNLVGICSDETLRDFAQLRSGAAG